MADNNDEENARRKFIKIEFVLKWKLSHWILANDFIVFADSFNKIVSRMFSISRILFNSSRNISASFDQPKIRVFNQLLFDINRIFFDLNFT